MHWEQKWRNSKASTRTHLPFCPSVGALRKAPLVIQMHRFTPVLPFCSLWLQLRGMQNERNSNRKDQFQAFVEIQRCQSASSSHHQPGKRLSLRSSLGRWEWEAVVGIKCYPYHQSSCILSRKFVKTPIPIWIKQRYLSVCLSVLKHKQKQCHSYSRAEKLHGTEISEEGLGLPG